VVTADDRQASPASAPRFNRGGAGGQVPPQPRARSTDGQTTEILPGGRHAGSVAGVRMGLFLAGLLGVLMAGILVTVFVWILLETRRTGDEAANKKRKEEIEVERQVSHTELQIEKMKQNKQRRADLEEMYRDVLQLARRNPDDRRAIVRGFRAVLREAGKLDLQEKYRIKVEKELRRLDINPDRLAVGRR
jgi:hypothetical protein